MYKKLPLFLGMLAVMATNSLAQNNNFRSPSATKVITGTAGSDPFGLFDDGTEEKAAGVKPAGAVKMAAAENTVFALINQKRAEKGLSVLVWSDELATVARLHSQNMAEFKFFGHRGLDDKMVSDRADDCRLGRWRAIGENIAYNRGYQDPLTRAVDLWLDSPPHRHNMMDSNWKQSAVGVAVADDGSYYFTQVFLKR
jgi:uncharacterized protein YkwD